MASKPVEFYGDGIQLEAIEAAGRFIPMVQENVRGAQPWVGRAPWHYGSYYLCGDVPALMPTTHKGVKVAGMNWAKFGEPDYKAVAFNDPRHHEGTKAGKARKMASAKIAKIPFPLASHIARVYRPDSLVAA